MMMTSFLRLALCVLVSGFLVACDPPPSNVAKQTIPAGTVANYKVGGHHYRAEITHAKDGYTQWEFTWKKAPVFKFKTYRGLLSVYNEEEGYKSWSKFDTKLLDSLFPLTEGQEVTVEGRHYANDVQEGYPFYVTIHVRGKSEIMIKETSYPVYILDYSVVEDHPDGTKTYIKTAWYSEDLEAALRTDYKWETGSFSMRMVSFEEPEGFEEEKRGPEGLGTVRL